MSRFIVVSTRPYQERAIINLDSVMAATTKTEPDGGKSIQLQMVDGTKILIIAEFTDIQQALSATPL